MSRNRKWSPEEDKILRDNYPKQGINVTEMLPGRTVSACRNRACDLGIRIDSKERWTTNELDILQQYYTEEPINKLCSRLSKHTKNAIYKKAERMGIQKLPRRATSHDAVAEPASAQVL